MSESSLGCGFSVHGHDVKHGHTKLKDTLLGSVWKRSCENISRPCLDSTNIFRKKIKNKKIALVAQNFLLSWNEIWS